MTQWQNPDRQGGGQDPLLATLKCISTLNCAIGKGANEAERSEAECAPHQGKYRFNIEIQRTKERGRIELHFVQLNLPPSRLQPANLEQPARILQHSEVNPVASDPGSEFRRQDGVLNPARI